MADLPYFNDFPQQSDDERIRRLLRHGSFADDRTISVARGVAVEELLDLSPNRRRAVLADVGKHLRDLIVCHLLFSLDGHRGSGVVDYSMPSSAPPPLVLSDDLRRKLRDAVRVRTRAAAEGCAYEITATMTYADARRAAAPVAYRPARFYGETTARHPADPTDGPPDYTPSARAEAEELLAMLPSRAPRHPADLRGRSERLARIRELRARHGLEHGRGAGLDYFPINRRLIPIFPHLDRWGRYALRPVRHHGDPADASAYQYVLPVEGEDEPRVLGVWYSTAAGYGAGAWMRDADALAEQHREEPTVGEPLTAPLYRDDEAARIGSWWVE